MNYQQRKRRKQIKRACMHAGAIILLSLVCLAGVLISKRSLLAGKDLAQKSTSDTVEGEGTTEASVKNPKKQIEQDILMLVNKENPLPEDYQVSVTLLKNKQSSVAEVMYEPLRNMLTAGSDKGLSFTVASGFRDIKKQRALLKEEIHKLQNQGMNEEEAYAEATREMMPPGYSEHETGLAIDIVATSYQLLDTGQEKNPENVWLQENCKKYGFILRYPKEKESITGIDYESWHFRYVGKEAAEYITDNQLTLEEYLKEK